MGRVEVLARRVGRNELTAMEVCRAYVEAQTEYASRDRTSGRHFAVCPEDREFARQEGRTLLGRRVRRSGAESLCRCVRLHVCRRQKPVPYHGYYFQILKAQGPDAEGGAMDYVVNGKMIGGFALIAYPAEYGVSGIQTYQVNHRGKVYEKDLGPTTGVLARQMTRFNPDKTWKVATAE